MALIVCSLIKNVNSKKVFGKNALDEWLINISKVADKIVILDNMSDDGTYERIIKHDEIVCERSNLDFLTSEQYLHEQLWDLVRKHAKEGDMILLLASDEFIDENLIKNKKELISVNPKMKLFHALHIVHMWNKTHFRVDDSWGFKLTPRLFRFQGYQFSNKPLKNGIHHSALPSYVTSLKNSGDIINSCILHYGYSDAEQRKEKHDRYIGVCKEENDKNAVSSILDPNPRLIPINTLRNMMSSYDLVLSQREWDEIRRLLLN